MSPASPPSSSEWGFTDDLPPSTHVCFMYDDDAERRRVVSAYLAAGLHLHEAVRFVGDGTREEAAAWLDAIGVPRPAGAEPDALKVFAADTFYLRDGRCDPHELIGELLPRYEAAERAGYAGVRSCGEMSWALRLPDGRERLLEYESMLNGVKTRFVHHGMCLYDTRRFDGATLFNLLQLHPFVVARGMLVRNPFFTSPPELDRA